jgi:hypothetical protein
MDLGDMDVGEFSDQLRKCHVLMDSTPWRWNSARILGKNFVCSMGVRYWKAGGPLLLVLPNVTALLLLAATFLVLNWPPVSITSPAVKFSPGGVRIAQLGELNQQTHQRF